MFHASMDSDGTFIAAVGPRWGTFAEGYAGQQPSRPPDLPEGASIQAFRVLCPNYVLTTQDSASAARSADKPAGPRENPVSVMGFTPLNFSATDREIQRCEKPMWVMGFGIAKKEIGSELTLARRLRALRRGVARPVGAPRPGRNPVPRLAKCVP